MKRMERILGFVILVLTASLFNNFAYAEGDKYPTKAVKVILPYGAGGSTDLTSRVLMKEVEKVLGKPFKVENISGASGTVGTTVASGAPADGYTLLFAPSDPITSQLHNLAVPYKLNSFETVAGFSSDASVREKVIINKLSL